MSPLPESLSLQHPGRIHVSLHDLLSIQQQLHPSGLLAQSATKSLLLGLHQSRLRGRGMEFDQVRAYQPGDDVRNIDWRVTARTAEVHCKVFREEREHPIFLVVEQSPAMFFASKGNFKSVQAAYMAGLIAWAAQANHDRVGGLIFTSTAYRQTRPLRHRHAVLKFLNLLAEANQQLSQPATDEGNHYQLQQALHYSRARLKPGSLIILICDERNISPVSEALIQALARRFDLILIPVSDPMEQCLPQPSGLIYQQQRRFLRIGMQQSSINRQWQKLGWQRRQHWQRLAQLPGVLLLPLTTSESLAQQLSAYTAPGTQHE